MSNTLNGLNKEQLEAATYPSASVLVLAGAGSGKTRVLTTRIAWLIETNQINPLELLAVTFTNKAAKEMLLRISTMLPINTRGMWVGTFHGLCNRLLRTHHPRAKLSKSFQILDSADQLSLVKRVMKGLSIDDNKFPFKHAQYFINSSKEEGLRPDVIEQHDEFGRTYTDVYRQYEKTCANENVVDFAELLLRAYELLSNDRQLLNHYQTRFKHILIDEFQDTNKLQYAWLKLLAGDKTSVMAVGDDDQSIYAFRGARTGNMLDFETDFSVHKIVKLEQNYRSHGNILDGANALIKNNEGRLGKNLWTDQGEGEPIRVYNAMTDGEECSYIIEEIQALRNSGSELKNIALLYRSNAQSRVLEHGLFRAGLPYRVYGGLRFFERQEVKHALAYLRLLSNPSDDGAFLRVVNFPSRGIGNRTLELIQDVAQANGISLWEASSNTHLSGRAASAVEGFLRLIRSIKEQTLSFSLPDCIEHVIDASGLTAHYLKDREGQDRVENLNELVNASSAFAIELENNDPVITGTTGDISAEIGDIPDNDPLTEFLAHASLEAGENQASAGEDALQLMTIHSSKGLEFHTVFISGLEEGLFPHENSINEHGGLEEERRLMYVAMTRAMRRLYLSHSQMRMLHGQSRYNVESRFIEEIPDQLLKKINEAPPKSERHSYGPSRAPGSGRAINGFTIGEQVNHAKFGFGVIVQAEGSGSDARLQVNFRDNGLKWLALEYAKLEKV